jgi:hypothetical protein
MVVSICIWRASLVSPQEPRHRDAEHFGYGAKGETETRSSVRFPACEGAKRDRFLPGRRIHPGEDDHIFLAEALANAGQL